MNNSKYKYSYIDGVLLNIAGQTLNFAIEPQDAGIGDWAIQGSGLGSAKFSNAWQFATGKGVSIGIVDEAVNTSHADFRGNKVSAIQFESDSAPAGDETDTGAGPEGEAGEHGTQVTGIIGGEYDNGIAADGAAYGATLKASTLTYGNNVDLVELANILAHQANVDVSNNSWGFTAAFADNFLSETFSGMATALQTIAAEGRGGLGTSMVVAGGNSKMIIGGQNYGDDSNFHSFSNSRFAIAVGAHDADGQSAFFSSPGTNILISAPGVGLVTASGNAQGSQESTYVSGTSFAAPMVSAAIALMLEVNPDLGYRDIQEILAITATGSNASDAVTNGAANINGGGMIFDREMGFGALDAEAAVKLARHWQGQSTFGNEVHLDAEFVIPEVIDGTSQSIELELIAAENGKFSVDFVELTLDVSDSDLRDLSIVLISPDGTTAVVAPNLYAAGNRTTLDFKFSSVASWGENPFGTWTLLLDHAGASDDFIINHAALDVYGDFTGIDDTYYFTSSFAKLISSEGTRARTEDDDGGVDTLNFAAATGALNLSLGPNSKSAFKGKAFSVGAGFENAVGTTGNDIIKGNAADNILTGDIGNDRLYGGAGDDTLYGGAGRDTLTGGQGGDDLFGGSGFDVASYSKAGASVRLDLRSGEHKGDAAGDSFQFVEGFLLSDHNDVLVGASGSANEKAWGGDGRDTLVGLGGDDELFGGRGNDKLLGGNGQDRLQGGRGADNIDGGDGNDTRLIGGGGNDKINGGNGRDVLSGNSGNDILRGGSGGDVLKGGKGNDKLYGQKGNDVFVFNRQDGEDSIKDFGNGNDKIDLSAFSFKTKSQALAKFTEIGSGHNDKLMFDSHGTTIKIHGIDLHDLNGADLLI